MTGWVWTRLDAPAAPASGWASRVVAGSGEVLHLVVNAADGSRVGHVRAEPSGATAQPDLPLRRAGSAVAVGDLLVAAGVAAGADRPGLCLLGPGQARAFPLDAVSPTGGAAPVAAWPALAVDRDGTRVWVVWAEGGAGPAVHAAVLADGRLDLAGSSEAPGVLALQVAAAPAGGVDLLWQTGTGVAGRRLVLRPGRGPTWSALPGAEDDPTPSPAAALSHAAVVWPGGPGVVTLLDVGTGRRRAVALPVPPEGPDARVVTATVVRVGARDHLVWTARSRTGDPGPPAPDRCWVAALDPDGGLGPAEPVPAGVREVLGAGDRLVGWPTDGAPLAWVGTR